MVSGYNEIIKDNYYNLIRNKYKKWLNMEGLQKENGKSFILMHILMILNQIRNNMGIEY